MGTYKVNVVIFGEDSLIARNLADAMRRDPKYILINDYKTIKTSKRKMTDLSWGLEIDATDIDEVFRLVNSANLVINCSGLVGTDKCLNKPLEAYRSNVLTADLISRSCNINGTKLIHFGTTASYEPGPNDNEVIYEDSPAREHPTLYGATKLIGEVLVRQNLPDAMIFRPCFVYGGARDNSSIIKKLIYKYLGKGYENLNEIPLGLEYKKDYLYVDDLVKAVFGCLDEGLYGKTFNISYGSAISYGEILKLLRDNFDFKSPVLDSINFVAKKDYLKDHIVSNKKLIEATLWKPTITLTEGIKRIINEAA